MPRPQSKRLALCDPTPTPSAFYIHDDLSDDVRLSHGENSLERRLVAELFDLVRRDANRVFVLTVDEQIDLLISKASPKPFDVAIGIGAAGEKVARQVHHRAGWFPNIRRLDAMRQEVSRGGYTLISVTQESLEAQVEGLEKFESVAVVDDTLFSGFTLKTVLGMLPSDVLRRTHIFCLRCVRESLESVRKLCPVTAGFEAEGRILEEVSYINASGLVRNVGIRRRGEPSLAFYQRREWMEAWFPGYADEVIAACRRLNALLERGT